LFEKFRQLNRDTDTAKCKYLLLNLYYLSGYIIECIVKYGIYDLIGYSKDKEVTKLNNKEITYKDHIRFHKFERYTEHLNKMISSPIPLINNVEGIDKKVIQLYKKWDVEIRYSYDIKISEYQHYISFYNYSKKILKSVRLNVRG